MIGYSVQSVNLVGDNWVRPRFNFPPLSAELLILLRYQEDLQGYILWLATLVCPKGKSVLLISLRFTSISES
jgi:hypothetical protein